MSKETITWKCPECGTEHTWRWPEGDAIQGPCTMTCSKKKCEAKTKMTLVKTGERKWSAVKKEPR